LCELGVVLEQLVGDRHGLSLRLEGPEGGSAGAPGGQQTRERRSSAYLGSRAPGQPQVTTRP
jgi:hypothetical protein